jgi:hypothetical protein
MDDMVKLQPRTWKVLIVDAVGLKLVNSVCKLDDIHDCQFAAVESISNRHVKIFNPRIEGESSFQSTTHTTLSNPLHRIFSL